MARIASFQSRNTFRDMAKETYHFFLTRGLAKGTFKMSGIEYTATVNVELNAVFIDWEDAEYGSKATSFEIMKSWK